MKNILKVSAIGAIFFFSSTGFAEQHERANEMETADNMRYFCEATQENYKQHMSLEQTKEEKGYPTTLDDFSTKFDEDSQHCTINLHYTMHSNPLIEHFIKSSEGEHDRKYAVEFFDSQEGQRLIQRSFKSQMENFLEHYNHPNVTTEISYESSDELVASFQFKLFEEL